MDRKDAVAEIARIAKDLERKEAELQKRQNVKALVEARYAEKKRKLENHYKELLANQVGKLISAKGQELADKNASTDSLYQELNLLKKRLAEVVNSIANPSKVA